MDISVYFRYQNRRINMKKLILAIAVMTSISIHAQTKEVAYADGAQQLSGVSVKPTKALKNNPGVLILPAWMGITEHTKTIGQKLSALGYHTFIADIYGVGNTPKNTQEAAERSGAFKADINKYRTRIRLALEQLIKSGANAHEIVVIGYCFGGQGALEAARANMPVKGVVSFHGGLKRDEKMEIQPIVPNVLVLHGADDPYVPEAEVKSFQEEMKKSHADWQMIYYANAVHAFTEPGAGNDNSKGVAYNKKADKRSWQAMLQFFGELFN